MDSTALYDRLGAAITDDLRRAQFAVMRNALAGYNGTEVKSTGDGLMVAFASAADAVSCAVDMQRALADLRRSDARIPGTRVGVSVGEATHEDDDWYGPPVVEAARLCALADAGQILITSLVALLVGARKPDAFDFVDLGPRQLKGFAAPVGVTEVTWTADAAVIPLPYVVAATTAGPFVGRATEIDRLTDAWKQGHGLLLIGGEPGIGKTRVVAELAARVHAEGAIVLWGRSDEDLAMPYQPFVEALRHFIDNAPDDVIAGIDPQPDLARLVPELKERVPGLGPPITADPEVERLRMFDAVVEFLRAAARAGPMLIVLDDLHWASAPTLVLLRYLTREGHQPNGVVLAATYRDTELDRAHPLSKTLADVRRLRGVERVALGGLDIGEVTDLVDASGGDSDLASAVFDETEGNPFFVAEVLRHLAETGSDGGIPEGVREVIGHRLSRLSDNANRVLAVASAVGVEVDLDVLERVPDAAESGDVLDGLEEAAAAHLMRELPQPVGRFVFTHALVRQTLYAELSGARRARLHFRIAQAMEASPGRTTSPATIAHHYAEGAAAGGIAKAIEWAGPAAADARERLAYEEAVDHWERALQIFDLQPDGDPHERLQILGALVIAVRLTGDIAGMRALATEMAHRARAIGDARMFAAGAIVRADWGLAGIVDEEAEALLLEAIDAVDALGDDGIGTKAELLSTLAFYRAIYLGQGTNVMGLAEEGLALARQNGEPVVVARLYTAMCFIAQGGPDLDAQQRVLDDLATITEQVPERTVDWITGVVDRGYLRFTHLRHWPIAALQRGDIAAFDRGLHEMREGQDRAFGWLPLALADMWTAMRALMDGRLDDAEEASNRLPGYTDDINFFNSWAGQLFSVNRERGTLESVRDMFVAAAEQTPGLVALQALVALTAAEAGEVDEARQHLERIMADPEAVFAPNSILPGTLAHLTNVAHAVGTAAAPSASLLLDSLMPYSGQLLVVAWGVTCEGAADRYIGMCLAVLGRRDEARAYLERALELERRVGSAPFVARTEAVLTTLGDR